MTNRPSAAEAVALARQLDKWADRTGSVRARELTVDLTDLYTAATMYAQCVERLANNPELSREDQGKILVQAQTWLYDELADHLESLKTPLQAVIDEICDEGDAQE